MRCGTDGGGGGGGAGACARTAFSCADLLRASCQSYASPRVSYQLPAGAVSAWWGSLVGPLRPAARVGGQTGNRRGRSVTGWAVRSLQVPGQQGQHRQPDRLLHGGGHQRLRGEDEGAGGGAPAVLRGGHRAHQEHHRHAGAPAPSPRLAPLAAQSSFIRGGELSRMLSTTIQMVLEKRPSLQCSTPSEHQLSYLGLSLKRYLPILSASRNIDPSQIRPTGPDLNRHR